MKPRALLLCVVLSQLLCAEAEASVVLVGTVADFTTGKLESAVVDATNHIHGPIFLIQEQSIILANDLLVDGTPANPMGPGGVISSGTEIQSWFFHFDMFGSVQVNATASGVYDFGLPILGLIFSEAGLDGTDALLGNPGTIYPTGVYYRDSNDSEDPADMWSLLNPTTLSIEGLQNQGIGLDQLRVITATVPNPEPASIVVWGLLSLFIGGTAWWRGKRAT